MKYSFRNFSGKAPLFLFFTAAGGVCIAIYICRNFSRGWNGVKLDFNPPGGRYGLCLHEVKLLGPSDNLLTASKTLKATR